jgi:hypothetical protein
MKNMFKKLEAESLQKNIDQFTGRSELQNALKATNAVHSYQEKLDKLMGSSAALNAWKSMSAVNSYQEKLDKLMGSSAALNAWKSMSAVNSYQENLDKLMGSSAALSAINALNASNSYQKTIDQLVGSNSFQNAVEAFTKQPDLWKTLEWIAHPDEKANIYELQDTDLDEANTERQLQQVGEARDSNSFAKAFLNLPPWIQFVLLSFILHLILPVAQNVLANLVTPHVEKLLSNPVVSEREKIKQLKKFCLDELDLSNLRFIKTERLFLRENPSTTSNIKDELRLGQVVTVINKQRNWTEISYSYENGELLHGWVFSRYIEKFKQ